MDVVLNAAAAVGSNCYRFTMLHIYNVTHLQSPALLADSEPYVKCGCGMPVTSDAGDVPVGLQQTITLV